MKNTTTLTIEIEHDKALPESELTVTDVIAQRAYQWLHNCGVPCEVTAKVSQVVTEVYE
jgi:hypothetical protein